MEEGRHFHLQLTTELVDDFGTYDPKAKKSRVNFDQFCLIWDYLAKFRSKFEEYNPVNGVITRQQFHEFIQEQVGCTIHKVTLNVLVDFYCYLAFDACVHAQKKIRELSETIDVSNSMISIERYRAACNEKCVSDDEIYADNPPTYEQAISTKPYKNHILCNGNEVSNNDTYTDSSPTSAQAKVELYSRLSTANNKLRVFTEITQTTMKIKYRMMKFSSIVRQITSKQ